MTLTIETLLQPKGIQLLVVFFGCVDVAWNTDVALLQFMLVGNKTTTSEEFSGPCIDIAVEELTGHYGQFLNFTQIRISDSNVTTCELMDQKATFW